MMRRLESESNRFKQYLDLDLQDRARECIPVDELHEEAGAIVEQTKIPLNEALLFVLLRWYRNEFMTWINAPPCQFCSSDTKAIGSATPTDAEISKGAGNVELYQCVEPSCTKFTRFPRYGSLDALMQTRSGRCGEWANLFALFCITMGFETRYVLDFTDHVWVEIYLEDRKRWVHCDPSEGETSLDRPLMYEAGWKKKLSYIFAFGEYDVKDVIRRYSRSMPRVFSRRTLVAEGFLEEATAVVSGKLRKGLSETMLKELQERDRVEAEELLSPPDRPLQLAELVGRKSGSAEWKLSRGETKATSLKKTKQLFSLTESDGFHLLGTSRKDAHGSIILTEDRNDQVGGFWTASTFPLNSSFIAEFSFEISKKGADGLAFCIQGEGPSALGTGGAGIGYAGIRSSLALEFDTYEGRDTCADPNDNHISLQTRKDLPNSSHHRHSIACSNKIPPLTGGTISVRFCYDHGQKNVQIWMAEDVTDKDDDFGLILDTFLDLPATISKPEAHMGFTASTGGISQRHSLIRFAIHESQ
ncbi:hypothetical protein DFJ73DRAFT_366124 [Zopfochytrium polystomum]|nr:hypothetical protein DFJ73DRAFT_366124 [Zopfochytrium polystomum]